MEIWGGPSSTLRMLVPIYNSEGGWRTGCNNGERGMAPLLRDTESKLWA